jgi:hypothetical protein
MSAVVIGTDPHKRWATIEVMASDEAVLAGGRHHGLHSYRGPVGGHLKQLRVLRGEFPAIQRADMQHADYPGRPPPAAPPSPTESPWPTGSGSAPWCDTVEEDRPALGGDTLGESLAHWDQYALAYLLFQPGRRGRD